MTTIKLTVNGKPQTVEVEPSTPLLYVLRNDLGLQGPRFGCGLGQCGACTVIIRRAVRRASGPCPPCRARITTLGLATTACRIQPDRRAGAAVASARTGRPAARARQESHSTDAGIAACRDLCRRDLLRIQAAIKRAATVMASTR
jgi:hypothetical protein